MAITAKNAQLYGLDLELGLETGLAADVDNDSMSGLVLVELLSPYHQLETRFKLESQTALAFQAMADSAAKDGIKLAICSAYRPFDRQLAIWNAKASGKRVVLDINEQPVDITPLSESELVDLILLWSALPGASRHHWGTDIDVFDAEKIEVKSLRLVEAEYRDGGPCAQLHQWLVANAKDFGFYFPFQRGQSAVSAEPWHISYFPVSQILLPQFEVQALTQIIAHSDMLLKDAVLARLPELVAEYVHRIAQP
ncbi:M15 family metallopeptidase [Shewanella oneidensis MR-1]|uniref:D-alanyl-D-alanine carboxypeptidase VanY family n=2 Tax=Shewanella oneidensis TaxID=70863 RepID=Q8EEB5_SHEON|nr:D-alanyl-D-alanine carboxypeptidase VanY family [Shewanella oneidensis MR-1]QKG98605.1 M15 family metallopeptidase [Shewanella oneidensis MR-1]